MKQLTMVVFLLSWVVCACAQTSLGRIRGTISDPNSAVIPAVEITAVNDETGVSTRTKSNEVGVYTFPALQPGRYTLTATAAGFKKSQRPGVILETSEALELDVKLQIGELSETVNVTAEAPLLESNSSSIGQFMDNRVVRELPMNARRSLNLVAMSGAAVFLSGGEQSYFSLGGGRARNSNFLIDGGNIQNVRIALGQIDADPPVTAVREFRVMQNSYSAEYGGSAGGLVMSTTVSGTNDLHGSVYEYFRNDALEAPGFFAPIEDGHKVKPVRRYNLFGASLGGPIIKNRTHFFATYEGTRHLIGSTSTLTVPSDIERKGDFSQSFNTAGRLVPIYDPATTRVEAGKTVRSAFPGNVIPAARQDAVTQKLVRYWPVANRPATNIAGALNFIKNGAAKRDRDAILTRVDHVISPANRLYGRYFYNKDPNARVSVYPEQIADAQSQYVTDRDNHSLLIADTYTLSPTLLTETRYSLGIRKNHEQSAGLGSKIVEEIGLKGVPTGAFPAITVTGIAGIGNSAERRQFPIRQHHVSSSWTWSHGNHLVKFGGEIRTGVNIEKTRAIISGQFGFADTATALPGDRNTGLGFASFLVGFANNFSLRDTGQLYRKTNYLAGFFQDDWKLHRDLTLNLGVRWETDTPMSDGNNRLNGFDTTRINPISGTPGVVTFAGVDGTPSSAWDADWNNFGPPGRAGVETVR